MSKKNVKFDMKNVIESLICIKIFGPLIGIQFKTIYIFIGRLAFMMRVITQMKTIVIEITLL